MTCISITTTVLSSTIIYSLLRFLDNRVYGWLCYSYAFDLPRHSGSDGI